MPYDVGRPSRRPPPFARGPRAASSSADLDRLARRINAAVPAVIRERTPSLGEVVAPRLTYPLLLITLPKSSKHVHVKYAGRA